MKIQRMNAICSGMKLFFLPAFVVIGLHCPLPVEAQTTPEPKKLMVHYMAGFEADPVNSLWGWHWTENHFNPNNVDAQGRREIASHYYPLIGPYDSNDPLVLECQALQMKFAGIDGVIVDWYGTANVWDYPTILRNTQHIISKVKYAGLSYSICYEDQTIKHMIDYGLLPPEQAIAQAQNDVQYMEQNWFNDASYLKLDGTPVLLDFGPQKFQTVDEWVQIFSVLSQNPLFFCLNDNPTGAAAGAFAWPPMSLSENGVLTPERMHQYLDGFYAKGIDWDYCIGGAFPGFHDIYAESGYLPTSYGFLDDRNGATFIETLDKALQSDANIVQLVTWNDYEEGTMIEPTAEFGYQYLEAIQERRRQEIDPDFLYSAADLRLPLEVYNLKIQYQNDPVLMSQLNQVTDLLFAGDVINARNLITTIPEPTALSLMVLGGVAFLRRRKSCN